MNTRIGLIILAVICIGLGIGLFATKKKSTEQSIRDTDTIITFSNQLVTVTDNLNDQHNVNIALTNDLAKSNEKIGTLSNQLSQTAASLTKSEESLKAAHEQIERETAKIADLESQNQNLDRRALELSTTITNLNMAIEETQRKLNAAEGDKAYLEKELQRLMAEKAELERQFNDLAVLRAQVRKLKEELAVSRRLDWLRRGLFGSSQMKGGQLQMQQSAQSRTNPPATETRTPHYNLNVEVEADGTIRVIPPLTNAPASTNQ